MCSVENCGNKNYSSTLCEKHYVRFKKYGDPLGGIKNHASPEERFERFLIKSDGCWRWSGKKNNGYGVLSKGAKKDGYFLAHRFSWELHNKQKIPEGMFVMHKCDNPECTNPDHLTLGTPKQNTQDMIAKGRKRTVASVGLKNGKSLLDEEKVRLIRQSDLPNTVIAKQLGVSAGCVRGVRIGRTWSHVPFHEQLS